MKVIAVIREESKVLIEATDTDIANIMGTNSIYSDRSKWMKVGVEIPIGDQYRDVEELKNLASNLRHLLKNVSDAQKSLEKMTGFEERLNFNKK